MFLLAFHIVSVGAVIVIVWAIAFARGRRAGERRLRRQLDLAGNARAPQAAEGAPGS